MVKIQGSSDADRLEAIVRELVEKHGHRLDIVGWTRKTYDVYDDAGHKESGELLMRIESFVTTSGEFVVFDDRALPLAEELGKRIEVAFDIAEATIHRKPAPQ